MKKFFATLKKFNILYLVLTLAFILRFVSLGYSNYQGDEIKALFLPEPEQSIFNYLMDQRKGPVQFAVSYLVKLADPDYSNRFFARLPFAVAGFLAVYFFYGFVEKHFGKEVATYASLFFATNGFLIAFSRIVQYQSFVILFMLMALYFLSVKKIWLGLIFWALSILSHYDGVLIAPFAFYLIFIFLRSQNFSKRALLNFFGAGLVSALMLAVFYIPFVQNISKATSDYWIGRLSGSASTKISSSRYLFSVYQPIYVLHIYTILAVLGTVYSIWLVVFKKKRLDIVFCGVWALVSLLFMEVLVYIPGTHIYVYLIPGMVFLGFGIVLIRNTISKFVRYKASPAIFYLGTVIVFSFVFLQSYMIYVDSRFEYPWEEERFLIWTFPKPVPHFHLSMFGFPYYRNWEGIESFIKSNIDGIAAYSTNERKTIARYHVSLPKDTKTAGFYVFILNPQSFTDGESQIDPKALYWMTKYPPDFVYSRYGRDLSKVYIMETGSIDEIILKGF